MTTLTLSPEVMPAHDAPIKMLRCSRSGRYLATGDTDLFVKIWEGDREVLEVDPHSRDEKIRPTENIRGIEFSADEEHVYVAASDTLNAYRISTGELEWQYRPPRHFGFLIVSPQAIAVSPSGEIAASFNYGSMACFSPTGEMLWRRGENYAPRFLAFCPQGKALVGAEAFNLCVWDAVSGDLLHRWPLDNKVFAMAASPIESLVVTRELHTVSIYDISEFTRICQLPAGRGLPCLAVSGRDRLLATGEKHRIRQINLECQGVGDIPVDETSVLSVAFSADGSEILAGCADGTVRRWRV